MTQNTEPEPIDSKLRTDDVGEKIMIHDATDVATEEYLLGYPVEVRP